MMKGSCHCGRVTVEIAHRPDYANFCDCSLCAKMGGVWSYFAPEEVIANGETNTYSRTDIDEPVVVVHFCPHCGTTTHWRLIEGDARNVSGVNLRIFEPDMLVGIEARFPDGRHWNIGEEPQKRRPDGILGKDAFL